MTVRKNLDEKNGENKQKPLTEYLKVQKLEKIAIRLAYVLALVLVLHVVYLKMPLIQVSMIYIKAHIAVYFTRSEG